MNTAPNRELDKLLVKIRRCRECAPKLPHAPRPECAPLWRAKLFARIPNLELVLLVGQYSQRWHLEKHGKENLTETVRAWQSYLPQMLPLPHPSWRNTGWLKKHPWFEEELLPELRKRIASLTR